MMGRVYSTQDSLSPISPGTESSVQPNCTAEFQDSIAGRVTSDALRGHCISLDPFSGAVRDSCASKAILTFKSRMR